MRRYNPERRRHVLAGVLGTALLLAFVSPLTAGAQPAPPQAPAKPDTGRLSARTADLAHRAAPGGRGAPGQPRSPKIPDNQPGGMTRLGDGRLVVDVGVDSTAEAVRPRIEAAGGEVLAAGDPAFRTVTVAVADDDLTALSDVPGVQHVIEVLRPLRRACGPIISEGDTQLKAATARSEFGVDGSGVTVGIVSDSFDRSPAGAATDAGDDVTAGDLPGPGNPCGRPGAVNKVKDNAPTPLVDEGRAMAQTVHDLAPGAGLAVTTGAISESSMATSIGELVAAGAKVVVDDLVWLNEPFYQDGPIAVAVNQARASGVAYFSAAGNDHMVVGGKSVGSYEALTYRGTPCPALPYTNLDCHSFNPGGADRTHRMTVAPGASLTLDLQWAQPRGGVTTDLDICILDATTGNALDCGVNGNPGPGTQQAFEITSFTNSASTARAVNVVVARYAGPPVRFKWVQIGAPPTSVEYSTSSAADVFGPTIFGHSGTPGAFSVAAVPYYDASQPQPYSSHGPVTLLFHPVPSTAALAPTQVLIKPDMAATDCVRNSFFPPGSPVPHRFCGTSNAAPHAAAVAALMLDADPAVTPAQLGTTLQSTAAKVGTAPATAVGAGLVDAQESVGALTGPAPNSPTHGDYDGDGETDVAVYRPAQGVWLVSGSAGGAWGTVGDVPVPGDYDGDARADLAVYRPTQGLWFVEGSTATTISRAWGTNGDVPVPGDYDGDGMADIAVYRPSQGLWFVNGSTGATISRAWGTMGDVPVPGDYDGDAKTDIAVYRPSQGLWFVNGSTGATISRAWGTTGDVPVPGDYDGDARTDTAVYRPSLGVWLVTGSTGATISRAWGTTGDVPVPGDYDGDAKTDVAVYRPSQGLWFVSASAGGTVTTPWGTIGDVPLPLPGAIRLAYFP